MENYIKHHQVGAGTYGVVYKATVKHTDEQKQLKEGDVVALKKIRVLNYKDGVSFTAIREIRILQDLRHENVVGLLDVFVNKSNVFLVYEFMETDMEYIVKDRDIILTPADIKSYMQMILRGVHALHSNWVLHRDLKPNNLLIGADGNLKLADFGFARHYGSPNPRFTPQIVTRWYRAPELLFGARGYGEAIDMWSVGCIFAELMLRTPYFPGDSDIDQLSKIFAALGTPTEEQWPGLKLLPDYIAFSSVPPTPFKQLFSAASDDAIDLISQMLRFNPPTRCTALEALKHPYFSNAPSPTPPAELPRPKKAANPSKGVNSPAILAKRSPMSPSRRVLESLADERSGTKRKFDGEDVKKKLF